MLSYFLGPPLAFETNQLDYNCNGLFFIGESLSELIKTKKKPVVLCNQSHAISIKPLENDDESWVVYDPNIGNTVLDHLELVSYVNERIGKQLYSSTNEEIPLSISSYGNFIEQGGLHSLCRSFNFKDILDELAKFEDVSLQDRHFEGLFSTDAITQPAWLFCTILERDEQIQERTKAIIEQFLSRFPNDGLNRLTESLRAIPDRCMANCLLDKSSLREELKKQLKISLNISLTPLPGLELNNSNPKIQELKEQISARRNKDEISQGNPSSTLNIKK